MAEYSIRSLVDSDREWVGQRIQQNWGAQIVVVLNQSRNVPFHQS